MSDTSGREQGRPQRRGRPPAPALNPDAAESESERRRLTRLARSRAVSAEWRARQRVLQAESAQQLNSLQEEVRSLRSMLQQHEQQREVMQQSLRDSQSDMQLLREQNDLLRFLLRSKNSRSASGDDSADGAKMQAMLSRGAGMLGAAASPSFAVQAGSAVCDGSSAGPSSMQLGTQGTAMPTSGSVDIAHLSQGIATLARLVSQQRQHQASASCSLQTASGSRGSIGVKRSSEVLTSVQPSPAAAKDARLKAELGSTLQQTATATISPSVSASMSLSSREPSGAAGIACGPMVAGNLTSSGHGEHRIQQARSAPCPLQLPAFTTMTRVDSIAEPSFAAADLPRNPSMPLASAVTNDGIAESDLLLSNMVHGGAMPMNDMPPSADGYGLLTTGIAVGPQIALCMPTTSLAVDSGNVIISNSARMQPQRRQHPLPSALDVDIEDQHMHLPSPIFTQQEHLASSPFQLGQGVMQVQTTIDQYLDQGVVHAVPSTMPSLVTNQLRVMHLDSELAQGEPRGNLLLLPDGEPDLVGLRTADANLPVGTFLTPDVGQPAIGNVYGELPQQTNEIIPSAIAQPSRLNDFGGNVADWSHLDDLFIDPLQSGLHSP